MNRNEGRLVHVSAFYSLLSDSRSALPFFTTKQDRHGTGLGLATVYGSVKQSHGHILVESELGRGSTFRVFLPRIGAEADQVRERPAMLPATAGGVVLLVEDDEAVRTIARRVLVRAGYTVVEAASGREAFDLIEDGIDLVISDIVMPDMGGPELQKRLGEKYPNLKVILTSGYSEAEVKGETRQLGAAFLPKPFTQQSSPAVLQRSWDGRYKGADLPLRTLTQPLHFVITAVRPRESPARPFCRASTAARRFAGAGPCRHQRRQPPASRFAAQLGRGLDPSQRH